MDHWSIKDLKTFCEQQGIDHRDCVEKPELVKIASAHAQGLFEAHRSGAKSREDSGARSGGASATGASATGAGAAESAATAGGGRSSSEATGKARVNLEKLEVGARLYEKFAEASRALGLDDVGTSDAVRAPPLGTLRCGRCPAVVFRNGKVVACVGGGGTNVRPLCTATLPVGGGGWKP